VNAASVHELELAKVEDHEARLQLGRGHLKRPQCGRGNSSQRRNA
jgi:hypothetical protein